MIKIIAIGNSFSQDAMYYLNQIGAADNIHIKAANLYIGKCNLERHWDNIKKNSAEYLYELNGKSTDIYVSIEEALKEEDWDYVVLQQASHDSGIWESYMPFLKNMTGYIKRLLPNTCILLHQTWAYEIDSIHPKFRRYDCSQQKMYAKLCSCYKQASEIIDAKVIPSGDAVQLIRTKVPFIYENGGMSICRDGFHMNVIYGRYLTGAVWYEFLTGKSCLENSYVPSADIAPGAVCREEILDVVKETAHEIFI